VQPRTLRQISFCSAQQYAWSLTSSRVAAFGKTDYGVDR
jgi:hypothetical protein